MKELIRTLIEKRSKASGQLVKYRKKTAKHEFWRGRIRGINDAISEAQDLNDNY